MMLKFIFLFSMGIVFYSYIGYGILIYLFLKLKRLFRTPAPNPLASAFEPAVTLVVSAYNESDFIERKIKNSLELEYPAALLR